MKTKNFLKMAFLLLALVGGVNSVWADDVTITWPMIDGSNATSQAGSANVDNIVTVNNATLSPVEDYNSLAWGSSRQLKYSSDGTNIDTQFYAGGVSITNNPNSDNDDATVNENCYLKFTFTLASGVTFTPTEFSFECGKAGTDHGCVQGALVLANATKSKSSIMIPTRTDKRYNYESHVSKSISSAPAYDGEATVTFYIYIGGKLSGKSIYFSDVTIKGTYTVSAVELGIKTNPVSANYVIGDTPADLTVEAKGGSTPYSYKWYTCDNNDKTDNPQVIPSAISAIYTPSTASVGTSYYFCEVTDNASDVVTSNIAAITVIDLSAPTKPTISGAPGSGIANGTSVTLTASSTGTPTPTYQWYSNTTSTTTVDAEHLISGATSATYSPSTTNAGTKYYYVVATNSEGSKTSDAVSVTVNARTGCDLTKLVYSNSFDAFINEATDAVLYTEEDQEVIDGTKNVGDIKTPATEASIVAYYMFGDEAPSISSVTISDGATYNVEGTTLTVTAEDGTTTKDYNITLEAVTPYTTEGSLTFDGTETWIKTGYTYNAERGWRFAKNSNDGRIPKGWTRLYFFVGPAKTVTLTNGGITTARGIKVYVNGVLNESITSIAAKTASINIPCSTAGNNMIAIVSDQSNGDGGFTSFNLALTVKSLKVQYKLGDAVVKEETLATPANYIGDTYTVPFRMYVEKDGALYMTTKESSNPWYGKSVTLTENTVLERAVSSVDLGGGTLVLCEDLDGKTGNNADVRASNCSSYDNTQFTSEEDLPAGKYTFIVKAYSRNRGSSVKVGDKQVFTIAEVGNNGWTDKTFTDVIVPTAGKLALVQGASSTDPVDIIIAIRTGDATTSINLNASGYATYSTYYDVAVSGAKAYTAELDFANKTITCKEIGSGKVPAGNGVLLYGEANAEVTLTPTADASALGTNNLKATTNADGTLVTKGSNTYYALSGDTFKEYTGDIFVHHKAFFEVEGGVVQARNFTIVFDEESTGINEVKHGAISNNRFYNLNGQEVAQPTKGLYIMNGKKVIIK